MATRCFPGASDDIAAAVAFLCSDAAAFVSGCDVRVDGGLVAAMDQPGQRMTGTEPRGDTVTDDNDDTRQAIADERERRPAAAATAR